MFKFSHFAEDLGGKVTLFKVTYLGEEVGAGTRAQVRPAQPEAVIHLKIHPSFHPSFLPFLLPFSHESEPPRAHTMATGTEWQTEAGMHGRHLLSNIL